MYVLDEWDDIVSPSWFKYNISQKRDLGRGIFPYRLRTYAVHKKAQKGLYTVDQGIVRTVLYFKSCDYISIPKSGSTTMRLLKRWCHHPDLEDLQDRFSPPRFTGDDSYDPWPTRIQAEEFNRLRVHFDGLSKTVPYLREGFPAVTIVRNPYERCISALKDLLTKKVCRYPPNLVTSDLLSDFIEEIPLWIDPHLWPAHFFVRDKPCRKVPMSEIQSLVKEIHDKEYPRTHPFPWLDRPVTNASRVKQKITYDDLRPAARSILERYYAIDFEKGLAG